MDGLILAAGENYGRLRRKVKMGNGAWRWGGVATYRAMEESGVADMVASKMTV